MKVVGIVGAGILAAALFGTPAQARCLWNGFAWQCGHNVKMVTRVDRERLRADRAELRQDRRIGWHARRELRRDMHFGSSAEVARDARALHRARHLRRADRRDLREDRFGY